MKFSFQLLHLSILELPFAYFFTFYFYIVIFFCFLIKLIFKKIFEYSCNTYLKSRTDNLFSIISNLFLLTFLLVMGHSFLLLCIYDYFYCMLNIVYATLSTSLIFLSSLIDSWILFWQAINLLMIQLNTFEACILNFLKV